jgi:pyruvate/2-oxoglutarate dehydrogenase complex dihydrolipoamide dehydrogenase (E3) component
MPPLRSPDYDLTILGGGSGGLIAARLSAALGARTLLIEKERLGGECLHSGCVPSKSLLHVARLHHQTHSLQPFVQTPITWDLSMPQVAAFLGGVIDQVREIEQNAVEGVTVRLGAAVFQSPTTVLLDGERISSRAFLIATGSRPALPVLPGLAEVGYLTNETVFDLTRLPSSLVVIGGGPVGCELGQAFARLGTAVTLIQRAERLLPREDPEVSRTVEAALAADGVQIHTAAEVRCVRGAGNQKSLVVWHSQQEFSIEAEELLLAVGRRPNVEGLRLDAAGVVVGEHGIVVSESLRTSVPHIFAVGDVVGRYHFSHVAAAQAAVAVRNALLPWGSSRFDERVIPWCTFTDPEAARVGLLPSEAHQRYRRVRVVTLPYAQIDRALTDQEAVGFLKLVLEGPREEIVGAHLVGAHAGELLGELTLAIQLRLPLSTFRSTIHPYPTLSTGLQQLAFEAYLQGKQIHRHRRIIQTVLGLRRLLQRETIRFSYRKEAP